MTHNTKAHRRSGRSRSPRSRSSWSRLDNLVVTTALPVIRRDLHATISQLEWTVNAYTLTFAVLLLTGAALGDRFGRRRLFALGLLLFTGASAARGALDVGERARHRARRAGRRRRDRHAADADDPLRRGPAERRGLALGIWGGIGGLAIAIGPLVGGAVVSGFSWHWIFWLNVPIGLVLAPLALRAPRGDARLRLGARPARARARERRPARHRLGPRPRQRARLDERRHRRRRSSSARCSSPRSSRGSCARRRRCCRCSSSATARSRSTNVASLLMFFGMFGSIFLLAQFFQTVQALLAAPVRPAHPAVDGDADLHRADRRRALRPDRRPAR